MTQEILNLVDDMFEFQSEPMLLVSEYSRASELYSSRECAFSYAFLEYYAELFEKMRNYQALYKINAAPNTDTKTLYFLLSRVITKDAAELTWNHYTQEVTISPGGSSLLHLRASFWQFFKQFRAGCFVFIAQAEYLEIEAIQEIRDLYERCGVNFLLVSDREVARSYG